MVLVLKASQLLRRTSSFLGTLTRTLYLKNITEKLSSTEYKNIFLALNSAILNILPFPKYPKDCSGEDPTLLIEIGPKNLTLCAEKS